MNAVGDGTCHVYLVDETAGTGSTYNAVRLASGEEAGGSVSAVFPVPAGERSYSVCVSSSAAGNTWGKISAVFIPYNGTGGSTP